MTAPGRTWKLWACRYKSGLFMHVGSRRWVALHGLPQPIVPVLVEEILGELTAPEVTHYGWQYVEGSRYRHGDAPTMIQIRVKSDPGDRRRAMMALAICFPYGLDAALESGEGVVVAMRVTERPIDQEDDMPTVTP